MMHEQEKSDLSIVAMKLANQGGKLSAESLMGGGRGERGKEPHAPDTEPGERVPGTRRAYDRQHR